jgi:hypothetical protein
MKVAFERDGGSMDLSMLSRPVTVDKRSLLLSLAERHT